jgi:biopolymer transport protein ExbD
MGMNVGKGGSEEPQVMMDINTTPLIDVMLVLLVMLIITIPIQLHAVNLEMPVGAPPSNNKPEVVKIDIDDRSTVYWQGVPVASGAELESKMSAAAAQAVQPEVHLRPNKAAKYQVVANVLSTTKRLGLTKLAVIGSEQFVQ